MTNTVREYTAWTDGAYKNSTGQGGWAYVLKPALTTEGGHNRHAAWGDLRPPTSNQRAELHAVIEVVKVVPVEAWLTVYSDSQYVIYTLTKKHWKRRANTDLWAMADEAISRHEGDLELLWVPRNSTPELVEADELAKRGSIKRPILTVLDKPE